jgi:hypothetical protein
MMANMVSGSAFHRHCRVTQLASHVSPPLGLYQQLLTEGLEQKLHQLKEILVATDGLDPQEAPRLLSGNWRLWPASLWST